MNTRSVAQTLADSVAIVAVDRGDTVARQFAREINAEVVLIARDGNTVTVTVRHGNISASAGATKPK